MVSGAAPVKQGSRVRWAWIAVTAVIAPLVLVFAAGLRRDARTIPSPLIGKPAPSFTLPLFSGGPFNTADYRGRILIVNFWASWCYPACYEEAPHLQRVWERYKDRGVVVVGVNIQDRERPAREFIQRFGHTFPNGMDRTGRISIDYGVYGVPETFIIDQQGRMIYKHVGAVTEESILEKIAPLLLEGTGAP